MAPTFAELFGRDSDVVAGAPGRVNLIGEHTDYNDGYVLPIATPQETHVQVAGRHDRMVRAWSANVPDPERASGFALGEERRNGTWLDYVQGVTVALRDAGYRIHGVDLRIESAVPLGAGLSSSASLEVALLRALVRLFALDIDPLGIAMTAHAAETGFVGVPVGVMDQMAASLATREAALFIDTRSRRFERVPLPGGAALLVIDSGQRHSHADGAYRQRRAECDEAARRLGVGALRDADAALLASHALPEPLHRRARHVITENERVLEMRSALLEGELVHAGALMNASHRSMRDDFEVSTPQIDALVATAQSLDHVFGARLTGGGFGGCVVALVASGHAAAIGDRITNHCRERDGAARVLIP